MKLRQHKHRLLTRARKGDTGIYCLGRARLIRRRRFGCVVTSGVCGAGKTTTMRAFLAQHRLARDTRVPVVARRDSEAAQGVDS